MRQHGRRLNFCGRIHDLRMGEQGALDRATHRSHYPHHRDLHYLPRRCVRFIPAMLSIFDPHNLQSSRTWPMHVWLDFPIPITSLAA